MPGRRHRSGPTCRGLFDLDDDYVHLSALLIASHPRPVAEAIERHRRGLDRNPVLYPADNRQRLDAVRAAAAAYLGARPEAIALTESTTEGLGLVYNGLRVRPGQELLTTEHDDFVTHESLRLAAEAAGASVRRIALHGPSAAGADAGPSAAVTNGCSDHGDGARLGPARGLGGVAPHRAELRRRRLVAGVAAR